MILDVFFERLVFWGIKSAGGFRSAFLMLDFLFWLVDRMRFSFFFLEKTDVSDRVSCTRFLFLLFCWISGGNLVEVRGDPVVISCLLLQVLPSFFAGLMWTKYVT